MIGSTDISAKKWMIAVGVILLAGGAIASWAIVVGRGVDFTVLYTMGQGLIQGKNVYLPSALPAFRAQFGESPAGIFYPPATAFLMAPLALLPYRVALWTWFVAIDLTLVLGIRSLVRFAAPDAGAHVWMGSAGIVLASAVIRWGLRPLQPAPLILGLLCFFVVALHTDRPRTTLCIAMGATVAKMTLALPFLGLLALHRRFGAVAASVAALAGLNALGFLRMGASLEDYRMNVAKLEDLNNINSLDPWRPVALPRLDWAYLFYGLSNNVPFARGASLVASALAFVWLVREGLRARTPPTLAATALFLAPIVCFGSLCVYHHQYDACLFFAPALLACFLWQRPLGRVWPYALVAPFLLMILFLPVAQTQRIMESVFGLRALGLLKLSFPVVTAVAFVGSMAILRLRAPEFERYEVGG